MTDTTTTTAAIREGSSSLKRRDLLEACKIARVPMQQLETDPTAQLALAYLAEKRAGETDVDFETWLDEDLEVEVEAAAEAEEPAPS